MPPEDVGHVIARDQRAGIGRQVIDRAAVGKPLLHPRHAVAEYRVAQRRRRVVDAVAGRIVIAALAAPYSALPPGSLVPQPQPTSIPSYGASDTSLFMMTAPDA